MGVPKCGQLHTRQTQIYSQLDIACNFVSTHREEPQARSLLRKIKAPAKHPRGNETIISDTKTYRYSVRLSKRHRAMSERFPTIEINLALEQISIEAAFMPILS